MSVSSLGADQLRKAFGNLSVAQKNNLADPFNAPTTPDFQGLGAAWQNLPVAQQTNLAQAFQLPSVTPQTGAIPTSPLDLTGQSFGGQTNEFGLPTKPLQLADYFGGTGQAAQPTNPGFGQVSANSAGPGSLGGEYAVLDQYDPLFQQAAAATGMPVNTLKAIAAVERGWEGTSVAGAQGIMQVMPFWGQDFGLNLQDPAQNILAGAKVLASNYQQYGDMDTAVRAYLGFGTDAYGTTDQAYLQRVKGFEQQLNQSGGSFSGGGTTNLPTTTQFNAGNPVGNSVVQTALSYVGVPYVWGGIPGKGDNPWDSGWDCSGMTYWLDQNYGSGQLPMGSHYQYQYAQQTGQLFTDLNQLKPGDVVFIDTGWYGGAGGNLNRAGHVGMYIGNGQIVNAANPSSGTIISPLQSSGTVLGAMHMAWSGGSGGGVAAPSGGGQASAPVSTAMTPQQRLIALMRGGAY
jgi:cell wall-associated NlpC family hydrolase